MLGKARRERHTHGIRLKSRIEVTHGMAHDSQAIPLGEGQNNRALLAKYIYLTLKKYLYEESRNLA